MQAISYAVAKLKPAAEPETLAGRLMTWAGYVILAVVCLGVAYAITRPMVSGFLEKHSLGISRAADEYQMTAYQGTMWRCNKRTGLVEYMARDPQTQALQWHAVADGKMPAGN